MLNLRSAGKCILIGALALLAVVPPASARKVKPEQVLYDFCSQANCSDGASPLSGLIMDGSGNLYGTTTYGGNGGVYGAGVVYKLAPDGAETVLYRFCPQAPCTDGRFPHAGLVVDGAGNLYGTTYVGGTGDCFADNGCGVVFKVAPDGTETILYTFCSKANCADGATPDAGLVMDSAGNLYGTTEYGGTTGGECNSSGCGTAFEISAEGTESVLYAFCPGGTNCNGSAFPVAGLIIDGSGNLYGTTEGCGLGRGTVFKLAPGGTESVLHTFGQTEPDGECPTSTLVMDSSGNLYGTTTDSIPTGRGAVFKLAPDGTETLLHTFASVNDGDGPLGVILDSAGNLYGTTFYGGSSSCKTHRGCGTVFKLAPGGNETELYVFKVQKDGVYPNAGLVADSQGNLYGTASEGGLSKYGPGVVYKINIAAAMRAKH